LHGWFIIAGLVSLLGLTSPGLGAALTCTTYAEKTLGRWQTVCSDGTRATSYWNGTMERWETTVQPGAWCSPFMYHAEAPADQKCSSPL
jgi:hypothetical protein